MQLTMGKLKKISITLAILLLLCIAGWCQTGYDKMIVGKGIDYSELHDPHPANVTLWNNLPTDVVIGFGSTDIRYQKTSAPDLQHIKPQWTATAWKGERVHTQLLISARIAVNNLRVTTSALKDKKGNIIPASAVTIGFVR